MSPLANMDVGLGQGLAYGLESPSAAGEDSPGRNMITERYVIQSYAARTNGGINGGTNGGLNGGSSGSTSQASTTTTMDVWWSQRPISGQFFGIDLVVAANNRANGNGNGSPMGGSPTSAELAPSMLERILGSGSGGVTARSVRLFKLILPSTSGHVAASCFLHQRLVGCPRVCRVEGFLAPLAKYEALEDPHGGGHALVDFLDHCAGFAELNPTNVNRLTDAVVVLSSLGGEMTARLSVPWILPDPIERKRIALVRGRPDIGSGGPVYRAVASLGMDLVIIDEKKHWLQPDTAENRRHREAFLATDMTEDADVVNRIVKSIRDYPRPIHGIFTLSDNFFVAVAEVATRLGLPTSPPHAFRVSTDKYLSRQLQQHGTNSAGQAARVTSAGEVRGLLAAGRLTPSYPAIVKPTKGWSSECVAKVSSDSDLILAVDRACRRHGDSRACVIEPFFDGPEIDVNFILCDGKILFSEVADEPPCDGDAPDATMSDTFSAVSLMLPSVLPSNEQQHAITTMKNLLIKAGFRTGVFHVEARMVGSRSWYQLVDGVVDLVSNLAAGQRAGTAAGPEPDCKLVEINARPPAYRVTLSTAHTYGVNYFHAHALAAAGDLVRLAALSRPFNYSSTMTGGLYPHPHAQCSSQLIYIAAPGSGTVKTKGGASVQLMRRRPDLAQHVAFASDYFREGDKVMAMTDGARTFVAHFLVYTRMGGRRQAMKISEEIRREFRIELAEEDWEDE